MNENIVGGEKAKVLLLTGFLGSGKTTLLKKILAWETDLTGTVVLVSEFGSVGIDGSLLKESGSDVYELTSGCVCCSIRESLSQTLSEIWDRFHPKRILLEATGVAEPDAVASVFQDPSIGQHMEIQKVVTVLDIRFWIGRDKFGEFFMNQAEQANLILLNKIDTTSDEKVRRCLMEMHEELPGAHVVPTIYCEIDPETLWSDGHIRVSERQQLDFYNIRPHDHDHHDHDHHDHDHHEHQHDRSDEAFIAFDFKKDLPLEEGCFNRVLEQVPWELFRIKGPVRFPDRTMMLNFVAGRWDWMPWDDSGMTSLAFVGWRVNGSEVLDKLERCVLTD